MEDYLIEFASPTLASLKAGSLFNYAYPSEEELTQEMERWNAVLSKKGVRLRLLRLRNGRALIYLYRASQMQERMRNPEIQRFLRRCGYCTFALQDVLQHLEERVQGEREFPHEIGIFLGYPLEDVVGFIRCKGCGYKCAGLWKVYGDEEQAKRCFAEYAKCRSIYRSLWRGGKSVEQLTVAV